MSKRRIIKLTPGIVNCLGFCGKQFKSKNITTNRICPACTRKQIKDRNPRCIPSKVDLDGNYIVFDLED